MSLRRLLFANRIHHHHYHQTPLRYFHNSLLLRQHHNYSTPPVIANLNAKRSDGGKRTTYPHFNGNLQYKSFSSTSMVMTKGNQVGGNDAVEELKYDVKSITEIIYAPWIAHTLYAVIKLNVFEHIPPHPTTTTLDHVSTTLHLSPTHLSRALNFLSASTNFLHITNDTKITKISLTPQGTLLTKSHTSSLHGLFMLEESPWHQMGWMCLDEVIKSGGKVGSGFMRGNAGVDWVDAVEKVEGYRKCFEDGMSCLANFEIPSIVNAYDWKNVDTVCDVGGNSGHILSNIIKSHHHITRGYVLDLPIVISNISTNAAKQLGVSDRVVYIPGDMFTGDGFDSVKHVDLFMLKYVLHDWSDAECIQILKTIHRHSKPTAKLVNIDFILPSSTTTNNTNIISGLARDVHMMALTSGKERTEEEFKVLFEVAGWKLRRVVCGEGEGNGGFGVLECEKVCC
ncbi:hypothetical protein HDU76_003950 [Blyttiomyces sp. JEL0837]|nr:hypothetical protein HDU76_003950 [Blyttiomyces sp. JEL0837]